MGPGRVYSQENQEEISACYSGGLGSGCGGQACKNNHTRHRGGQQDILEGSLEEGTPGQLLTMYSMRLAKGPLPTRQILTHRQSYRKKGETKKFFICWFTPYTGQPETRSLEFHLRPPCE